MALPTLLTFDEIAAHFGVSAAALKSEADANGLTIKIGRKSKILEDDVERLIELCRVEQKVRDCTGENARTDRPCGKFATDKPESRPAQTAAARLKSISRATSQGNTGQLVRLHPAT